MKLSYFFKCSLLLLLLSSGTLHVIRGQENPGADSTNNYSSWLEEIIFDRKVYLFELTKEKENSFKLKIEHHSMEGPTQKMPPIVFNEISSSLESMAIFRKELEQPFFDSFYAKSDPVKFINDIKSVGFPKLQKQLTVNDMNALAAALTQIEKLPSFHKKVFDQKIDSIKKLLNSAEDQASLEKMAQAVKTRLKQQKDDLGNQLFKLASDFLIEASGVLKAKNSGSPSGADANTHSSTPISSNQSRLKALFEKPGKFLHRKSVNIGNQFFIIENKKIEDNGLIQYIYKVSLNTKRLHFFSMNNIRPKAYSIALMSENLHWALDSIRAKRSQQLLFVEKNTIAEIARDINLNPASYTSQDRDYIKAAIFNAARNYGFNAQELQKELTTYTGISLAFDKLAYHSTSKVKNPADIDLDGWIGDATLRYTQLANKIDEELEHASSDFLFEAYNNSLEVENTSYPIGEIILREEVDIFEELKFRRLRLPLSLEGKLRITRAKIEFENEQIRNVEIRAIAKSNISRDPEQSKGKTARFPQKGEELIFNNLFPISFSTKKDVLFRKAYKISRNLYEKKYTDLYINLDEVIENDVNYYLSTENYSPRDTVIYISIGDKEDNKVTIFKEATQNILQAKIFSDFVGFDEDNPNGLIQTEVSKRFFLNTRTFSLFDHYVFNGYGNYIEPRFVLSKLEQNNRFLELKSASFPNSTNSGDTSVFYVSSLDIMNYSNLQIGFNMNLMYLSFPKLHMQLDVEIGGHIFQSGFANQSFSTDPISNNILSTENEFNENSLVYYPDIRMSFNPDPRFSLQLAWRPTWVKMLSDNVIQLDNEDDFLNSNGVNRKSREIHLFQMFASFRVNKETDGQFFFRTNFNMLSKDRNTNFLQVQVGYAFNIFSNSRKSSGTDKSTKAQNEAPAATGQ